MSDGKRARLETVAPTDGAGDLAALLHRLVELLQSGGDKADGLDSLLDELGRLQVTLNGASEPAFKAIADAQEKLQVAVAALQAAVDRFTQPPGYRPPATADEASVRSLLSYAHRLSYSSCAPLGYQPGQPLYFFKPPAPQEVEMRASQLHAFAREWEERQQALDAQRQAAARTAAAPAAVPQLVAPEALAAAAAEPPAASTGDLAALATAHGLDVQHLLASMPAGWKPGDPIPLAPPTAAAAAGSAAAPAAAQAAPAQPVAEPDTSPEGRAAPAAPRLAGIFLNELSFEEFEYVSEGQEESDSEESDSDDE